MIDIVKRLRASVRVQAIDGERWERSICASQMVEAANEIERLQKRAAVVEEFAYAANNWISDEFLSDIECGPIRDRYLVAVGEK